MDDLKKLQAKAVGCREAIKGVREVKGRGKDGGRSCGKKGREERAEEGSDLFPVRCGS